MTDAEVLGIAKKAGLLHEDDLVLHFASMLLAAFCLESIAGNANITEIIGGETYGKAKETGPGKKADADAT